MFKVGKWRSVALNERIMNFGIFIEGWVKDKNFGEEPANLH